MPASPRPDGKGMKIAYKILGKPANLVVKRTKKDRKVNQKLVFDETIRVR